jgi:NTE family protein
LTISVPRNADFARFPIPFAAVATDIATGEAVVLTKGDLADAVRASVSLPFVFTPITIDGRLLVDGGLVRNFPAEDAGRMGADVVIGVDIGAPQLRQEEIRNFLQVITQALFFADEADRRIQRALCDILILPDITGVSLLDFENPQEMIRRGEDAARAFRPRLDSLARLQGGAPKRPTLSVPSHLVLDTIVVAEAKPYSRRVVTAELGLPLRTPVSAEAIDRAVDRIAALGTYRTVSYRVHRGMGDTLVIRPREGHGGVLQAGLRYDTHDQASVLFNGTWNNVLGELSTGTVDLRLGEQEIFEASVISPLWFSAGLGGRASLGLRYNDLIGTIPGTSSREITTRSASLTLSAGSFYTRSLLIATSARMEIAGTTFQLTPDSSRSDRYIALAILTAFDNTDRPLLPRSGVTLFAGIDGAPPTLSYQGEFARIFGWLRGSVPLSRRFFFSAELFAGMGLGEGLPPQYLYRLGGLRTPVMLPYERFIRLSVLGFQTHELIGRQAVALHAAVHLEPSPNLVFSLRCSAAMADYDKEFDPFGKEYSSGIGLTGTYLTPVGPVGFTLMSGSEHDLLTFVTLGVEF